VQGARASATVVDALIEQPCACDSGVEGCTRAILTGKWLVEHNDRDGVVRDDQGQNLENASLCCSLADENIGKGRVVSYTRKIMSSLKELYKSFSTRSSSARKLRALVTFQFVSMNYFLLQS
jgi:hypothetical protein